MKWHDLLYFSKGERRALTLLTLLIAAAWLTLLWTNVSSEEPETDGTPYTLRADRPDSLPGDNSSARSESAAPTSAAAHTGGEKESFGSLSATPKASSRRPAAKEKTTRKPPASRFPPAPAQFPAGTVVELNTADTLILKKVPGIGSSFARRIIKYRKLLGGFYTVEQLGEVYGIDADRYRALAPWFKADKSFIRAIAVNRCPPDSIPYHPYLNRAQKRVLRQLRRQKGRIGGWDSLQLLEEFTAADRERLAPYLSFE